MRTLAFLLVLCLSVCTFNVQVQAETEFGKDCAQLTAVTSLGNVFYGDDDALFYLTLSNPDSVGYALRVSSSVTDKSGKTLYTSGEDFYLPQNTKLIRSVRFDVKEYGIFTLNVNCSGSFGSFDLSYDFARCVENTEVSRDVGVGFHLSDIPSYEKLDTNNEMAKKAGFGTVRDNFRWHYVEPQKGVYEMPEYSTGIIEGILENDTEVLINLCYHSYLYEDAKLISEEASFDACVKYYKTVAEYFKGKKVIFEIGNEPDYEGFAMRYVTGGEYAEFTKIMSQAIESVNGEAIILGPAVCSLAGSNARRFFEEFIAVEGITKYIDGFSYHPYNDDGNMCDEAYRTEIPFLRQAEYALELIDAAQVRDGTSNRPIKLWATEFGASSWKQSFLDRGYTEQQQASDLVRAFVAAKSEPRIERVYAYNFKEKGTDPTDNQHNYGIVDYFYNAKPAYLAIANMNKLLCGADFVSRYTDVTYNGRNYSGYEFNKKHKASDTDIFVMWEHTYKSAQLTLQNTDIGGTKCVMLDTNSGPVIYVPSNKTAVVYDMYGNPVPYTFGEPVDLTIEQLYVVCREKNRGIEITESNGKFYAKGNSGKPLSDVTLKVVAENTFDKKVVAMEQQVTDENGDFVFEFGLNAKENCLYTVAVFDGLNQRSGNVGQSDYGVTLRYFVNGIERDGFDDVNENDELRIKLQLQGNNRFAEDLMLAGAIYGKDGAMQIGKLTEFKWLSGDMAEAELLLSAPKAEETEEIKYFLWDKNMQPILEPLKIDF